ncbi:MAG: glycerophosphodiester phosphodiesterase [Burkholderiales bacterium]|nr:glycerophosphodiester phosphodiesterase [Burkholderiales bacterium]
MLNKTRWPFPRIIAHRGGGTLGPENTLVGLRLGAAAGFGGLEFDVRLARHGVPVLMHDATVDRTTDGRGAVVDRDAAELRQLDAGSWFGNEFVGEHVPTFDSAATLCRTLGLWANIELKAEEAAAADTGRIVAQQAARVFGDASPAPLLSSFSETALAAAKDVAPDLPRGLLVETPPADWRARTQTLGCRSLHCRHDAVTPELIAAVHDAGLGLLAYTVNDPGRAMVLFEWGIDAIVTDELKAVRADLLAQYGLEPPV